MSTVLLKKENPLEFITKIVQVGADFAKENKEIIVTIAHTVAIPVLLTALTSNVLYTIAYLLFTTYVYNRVQTEKSPYREIVLFTNTLWLAVISIFTTLILIGANATYLLNIIK